MTELPVKRPRGRPRKVVESVVEREPIKTNKLKMRAAPNWETVDPNATDTPDRLHISQDMIPEGMKAMWVTNSVLGQEVPQHRSEFERKGWTPVHQDDFEGQFNGKFMPKDREGEINVDGLVLMVRPKAMSDKSERLDRQKAYQQVAIKEQALTGGDIGVSLDSQHPSAKASNRIRRSMERIEIPNE